MKIETIKLSELHLLENNVRKHGELQIDALVKSLDQFGQTRAFVIDEANTILIGNGMYEAMVKRGDKTAAAYRVTGLTEKQKKKLVLSDNKVFQLGLDDFENIEMYIKEITSDGDFDVAGFDEEALRAMTRTADEVLNDVMEYGIMKGAEKKEIEEAAPVGVVTHAAATEETASQEGQDQEYSNTIICPSCGEIIRQ